MNTKKWNHEQTTILWSSGQEFNVIINHILEESNGQIDDEVCITAPFVLDSSESYYQSENFALFENLSNYFYSGNASAGCALSSRINPWFNRLQIETTFRWPELQLEEEPGDWRIERPLGMRAIW